MFHIVVTSDARDYNVPLPFNKAAIVVARIILVVILLTPPLITLTTTTNHSRHLVLQRAALLLEQPLPILIIDSYKHKALVSVVVP